MSDRSVPNQLALGIDCSTQSITATLVDIRRAVLIHEHSISYTGDTRLKHFPLAKSTCLISSTEEGMAEQPSLLFLAALDALLGDIQDYLPEVRSIGVSAQQHGHVYMKNTDVFQHLQLEHSAGSTLEAIFADSFSYPHAPIWMSSNTAAEAAHIRDYVGGREKMLAISGSDSPLRFSGAVIRRIGLRNPEVYRQTKRIHLISSLLTSVFCGRSAPIDYGNASGMSMMDYHTRKWSSTLLSAVSDGFSSPQLFSLLPDIAAPDAPAGTPATYFTKRFNIHPDCVISTGSGDNPQTKALVQGDLLSLGSSFVIMAESNVHAAETNAMYDGLSRPFVFGCRTNGALCWDYIRNVERRNNSASSSLDSGMNNAALLRAGERALESFLPGSQTVFFQPLAESFPPSPILALTGAKNTLAHDYPGIVDSTLAILRAYSKPFCNAKGILYVTGGPTKSPAILNRIAAFWDRSIVSLPPFGAALGAAINGYAAWEQQHRSTEKSFIADIISNIMPQKPPVTASREMLRHAQEYIPKAVSAYKKLVQQAQ